ncbi:ArsR/SmtB family transcription factor [Cryobacterium cryoconiti]|uniref:ArsR family transcriptional regulator n=1 Tax=Cryobacterium cryoconiti TaxID=1259239 RepID=A0A4Y8JWQ1_9MICO|nr:winged helix-turn-helix domain-containing protein [Cryobacterium cryoconiti]TFD27559.1 ArsR family transcriptional regulator [Cryobacterium cryoconiti]
MTVDDEIARLAALANPHRFRIIALLAEESLHVSELARRLGMSRALLYMHLQRLEAAGYVTGHLELSDDGKALKFFEVVPFEVTTNVASIAAAVAADTESTH